MFVSQLLPLKPAGHRHSYESNRLWQVKFPVQRFRSQRLGGVQPNCVSVCIVSEMKLDVEKKETDSESRTSCLKHPRKKTSFEDTSTRERERVEGEGGREG